MVSVSPHDELDEQSAALQVLQRRRKWLLAALIAVSLGVVLLGEPALPAGGYVHEMIEYAGMALIAVCILGRVWSTLYIGGRKKTELVQHGPYSLSRNPLYVFSVIGAAGLGALFGSFAFAIVLAAGCYGVFAMVARREEAFLARAFGPAYRAYCGRVPRFLPRLRGWQDLQTVEVRPRLVLTAMADSAVFLAAVPLVEGIEYLHDTGVLPTLFHLY